MQLVNFFLVMLVFNTLTPFVQNGRCAIIALQPIPRLTDAKFAQLVEAATNPSRTCIWKTKALHAKGYHTVAEGNAQDECEELLHFIGELTHIPSYPGISLSFIEHFGISQNK